MRTDRLWRFAGFSAAMATLLLAFGLALAVYDYVNPPADALADEPPDRKRQARPSADGALNIVALGDSLSTGLGDPTGLGYVGRLRDKLAESADVPVRLLNNLAVNGYRTDHLLEDLDKPSVTEAVGRADLIVFTIGGNDLFRYVREEIDVLSGTLTGEQLRAAIPEPAEQLGQIMARLSAIQPEALVVYVGLYNPFADLDDTRQASAAIAEWNARASQHAYSHPNILFVPVADLFERNGQRLLYSDHFHPNAEGHERMAERVFRALH